MKSHLFHVSSSWPTWENLFIYVRRKITQLPDLFQNETIGESVLNDEQAEQANSVLGDIYEKYHGYDVFKSYFGTMLLQAYKNPSGFLKIVITPNLLEQIINGNLSENKQLELDMLKFMQEVEEKYNMTPNIETIFSTMWYSKLPCYDLKDITSTEDGERAILKSCSWKGKEVPCSAIFKKVATDKGICCAFNSQAVNKTFTGSKYTSLLQKFEREDKLAAFDTSMGNIDLTPISGVYQIIIFIFSAKNCSKKSS